MDLKNYIATIDDFPKEGIKFRDITPLMADGEAFAEATRLFEGFARKVGADVIVGPESRGFIFGCPVAYAMNIGFVPVRKPGKLPRETVSYKYDLEYGSNELHIHKDGVKPGQKVLIIDDLLATGGTVEASVALIEELGAEVVGCGFLIELEDLNGRDKLEGYEVFTIMQY
ncbi:adenine phosphoribosyltransferase [Erysipelothrix rhusiopathiae]|uniref:Adenine phosphoribosyltransferase n=3 Tax=Erysipelothrix TaxID=1647 RepID=E7FU14_ERYRH|nr:MULTISPECIES: adenine phosphoribosyltransferase [Erysipelothrix]CAH2761758.1 adenine phosphoribosyltransferase [Erysipelothrix sp. A18Y020d]AGN23771.1 adenine phosphoribosyltransferase [Erysipelothrix rhusiopathiae SY1027]AMS11459.1 adenine phosphoribosyltransferase [Erysipelothrix rhusiopathiae]AOO67957.1 adenine phosphoribosyltransferase [Erysipelothrix rhusiopathiae]AWU41196.1 adenine phosphoribosyltransferase [Erysipelothrix rhusiopathiae]